ncbi:MAG: cupredoxin domain-containing protein [candidate division NC10 bacterium]|nr:cupredoxin domain-containing protein [candidate division NC10 bacterium]
MSGKTILWVSFGAATLGALAFVFGQRIVSGKSEPPAQRILLRAEAGKFNGSNPTLEVRRGVPVEITVRNDEPGGIPHDFALVGLDLKTPKALQPGEPATLRFTPSRPGEFAYTCTLHPGLMDGRLVVRP